MTEQNQPLTPTAAAQAPAGEKKFAGKFDSPEALEAAYKELETKLGAAAPSVDADALATAREAFKALGDDGLSPEQKLLIKAHGAEDKPKPAEKKPDASTENHGTKPEHAGLAKGTDFDTFDGLVAKGFKADEVKGFMAKMADGTFGAADTKAIAEKLGVPEQMVKGYVEPRMKPAEAVAAAAGREYTAQEIAHVQQGAGGAEGFQQLTAWAKASMQPAEIKAFNDAIDTGNPMIARLAVEGLKARHSASVGQYPQKRVNGEGSVPSTDTYDNYAELARAVEDPRYAKDPKYRAQVEAKAGRSKFK